MDVVVDVPDPADGDEVVSEAPDQIQLGQFDLVPPHVIDPAKVFTVGAEDFEVFANEGRVYHAGAPGDCFAGRTARPWVGLHAGGPTVGDVVNLNQVRKDRARAEAKAAAAANRASHGRSKAERTAADEERARIQRLLDGSKLED